MRISRKAAALAVAVPVLAAVGRGADPPWVARSRLGMVASDSPEASQIGAAVLEAGGNAFDAAVATSFALAVARPQSTGLGGGGFMLAYVAEQRRFVVLDFREVAPAAATPERYAALCAERGDGPSPSLYGGNAVGVPGQLAGLVEINRRFGSRRLAELIRPAIDLAERGFVIDAHFLEARAEIMRLASRWPELRRRYAALFELLAPGGRVPQRGERLRRPQLAEALRLIARDGAGAFYDGPIGAAVVRAVQAAGGALTADDLRAYRVKERTPVRGRFLVAETGREYEIVSMPPPSSGGVCLIEALNIIAACAVRSDIDPAVGRTHVLIEALKHAFADRARWLGDPDYGALPVERLTSRAYAARCAARIAARGTLAPQAYGSQVPDDDGTSHFCVVDRAGNVVALTETINGSFGSLVVAEPFGLILNNEMDDFLTVPGQANLYGLVQSRANLVGPGRRPLSSMSPTIVCREGRPVLVLGASGGPRIISSVLQVALHVMRGRSLEEAMTALRLHHQWQPDELYFDREPPAELVATVGRYGHAVSAERKTGIVQAIRLLPDGTLIGASDPRKEGRPAGVTEAGDD